MARDFEYERSHRAYDFRGEEAIQCKNFIVCGADLPMWWFVCKACYTCTNCDVLFGGQTLKISDHVECPICLEMKTCTSQPRCDHNVCVDCFKRCHYGDQMREGEPPFPYSDIEKEYDDNPDDPKWHDYPLIKVFHEEWNKWDDARIEKHENEEHLRKCPLCRK